jgi:glycerate 2-kinase
LAGRRGGGAELDAPDRNTTSSGCRDYVAAGAPGDFLARNDAYHYFEPFDALIRTGPTHTNVCDLRVVLTEGEG